MRRILLENISSGMKLAKPIFSADGLVLLNAGVELKEYFIERLQLLDVTYVYVEDDMTQDITIEDIVSEKVRLEAVCTAKKIMDHVRIGKNVEAAEAKRIANILVDELRLNEKALVNFIDMRTKDDYLFCHSVNVCILSILTGLSLGLDELRLRDLGIGALLHDIGKLEVSSEILQKKDRLTAEELVEIRKHADYGFEILRRNPDISLMSAHCAYQHHERFDGSGYPRHLKDQEIHYFAHIVAVADVYDALTSDNVYRRAVPVYEALAIIERAAGTYFNPEIVKAFVEHIAVFPIGSVVRLSNRQIGVVVDISREQRTKPVVRIIMDEQQRPVSNMIEIDLSKQPRLYVVDVYER